VKVTLADENAASVFARKLAPLIQDLGIVTLKGDLGAGKTTLVRAILSVLGYQGRVKSPTYTLVEPYQIGARRIYHFDLYRLADPEELEYLGFDDYLQEKALKLIEWPEKAGKILDKVDLELILVTVGDGRILQLIPHTREAERAVKRLQNDK
jgi:tRNA threonylcarbamoyladenosine biosynthesis protein TsaE